MTKSSMQWMNGPARVLNTLAHLAAAALLALVVTACGGGGDGSSDAEAPAPPGAETGSFDLTSAVALMQLCLQSYQMLTDFQSGKPFTLPAPYTLQGQFDTSEHFYGETPGGLVPIAYVATSGSTIYVVFRGTKTLSEWISDATFSQVDYPYVADGGKTETGFTRIYASIRAPIVQKVQSLAAGGSYTRLYVTGHSLGAALAVLAAPDLAGQTIFKQPVVYTFAGPRAGAPTFALRYNDAIATTWRVVNTNDEVPTLPYVVTTVIGPPPERKPEYFFYEHVDREYAVTFGGPIRSIADLVFNHSSCNYYATLCDRTSNPGVCKQAGQGLNGCSFN